MFRIKFHTKPIFWIFPISRINEMAPFCNLFTERTLYLKFCPVQVDGAVCVFFSQ